MRSLNSICYNIVLPQEENVGLNDVPPSPASTTSCTSAVDEKTYHKNNNFVKEQDNYFANEIQGIKKL